MEAQPKGVQLEENGSIVFHGLDRYFKGLMFDVSVAREIFRELFLSAVDIRWTGSIISKKLPTTSYLCRHSDFNFLEYYHILFLPCSGFYRQYSESTINWGSMRNWYKYTSLYRISFFSNGGSRIALKTKCTIYLHVCGYIYFISMNLNSRK